MRAGRRPVESNEQPVLDLLGQLVLEGAGQAVGLVPRVAQHVRQKALDDSVAAHGLGRLPPPGPGQLDAAVGTVVEQAPARQALDGGRRRPGRHTQRSGELACMGALTVLGQPENGLERLALRLGQGVIHGFGDPQPTF